jgi:leader peptidase (prepilin peptidase)/N-methyltransferase
MARAALLAVIVAALFVGVTARLRASWALPAFLVLAAVSPVLAWIDIERFLLPNRIVYPLTGAVTALLALAAVGDDDLSAFLRALLGGSIAFTALLVLHLLSPRSMGFGDVKLVFVLGLALAWLGWGDLVLGLFLSFLIGAVVAFALVALRVRGRRDHVPFGPFLVAGTMTAVVWGDAILRWYDGR